MRLTRFVSLYQKAKFRLRNIRWKRVAPKDSVLKVHSGGSTEQKHKSLCLFATFDPNGRIDPYVKEYLRLLSGCGFDIIVISTSPQVLDSDVDGIRDYCRAVIHRKNVGLDFGSWKAAMQLFPDWASYDRLLLANDSVYGPFGDLKKIFAAFEAASEPVCGLTDNFEARYHLQSYFLYFKQPLIQSQVFQDFWNSVRLDLDKNFIINSYEVGLSQHLLHHDVPLKALYPYYDVREFALAAGSDYKYYDRIRGQPVNSSLYMWDFLIKEFSFPFMKTEIVKINRLNFHNVVYWRNYIPEEYAKWRELIANHLKRTVPDARG